MAEPRAITYKEVGKTGLWQKVCEITGAGNVPLDANGDASIDITELSDAKLAQIDKLLDESKAAKPAVKKEGK